MYLGFFVKYNQHVITNWIVTNFFPESKVRTLDEAITVG